MKLYLASNYSTHPQMREIAETLQHRGHEVTSEWINGTHGGDDRAAYAQIDLRDIDAAEALIFFSESPAGSRTRGGKHVEFGYALAKGKRVFIVGPPVNVFHHLPEVIQRLQFEDLLPLL
jgi:nucleoside 2-deoxyribosyltransferase